MSDICLAFVWHLNRLNVLLQGRPGLLMPWYIITAIGICFSVIQIVQQFVNLQIGPAISGIFGVIIGCYLLVVVWSFR